ncbi:MAG: DUF1127 domain-containing protein [Maritimibacter sp.]|nr:DUF1127 domain-containing protein [Maritimibacter sp.]
MAHIAIQTGVARPSLRAALTRIAALFVAYTEARSRYPQVQALQALSDDQLAERGLTRDDIVRHVFADLYYL